ncbi:molybdate ABC transporter substrate-binding protein [Clostridium manihotivorum]|uniref:Molybdate ABC transporter substrate-binding protein n=2 Tax=Clostridium manihotivorum TaxID=2320868 RepID=A0A410DW96_9CLOT|nr:molybdate ABC transporter substrate-binding protein [Clostridium manihotivorum]
MIRKVKLSGLVLVLAIVLSAGLMACTKTTRKTEDGSSKKIMVFAAASLTESFNDIGNQIKKDKGIDVTFNYAGSQALVQEIDQSNGADVFASANTDYVDQLKKSDKVEESKIFAENKLIICTSKSSKKSIKNFKDLAQGNLKLVVGDKAVPIGSYFYKALDSQKNKNVIDDNTYKSILSNIKSSELNVKDVLAKVVLNEADAGVVYKTDVNEANKEKVNMIEDVAFNELKVQYPVALLKASKNKDTAKEFVDYIVEGKGKEILKKYGFEIK